MHFSDDDITEDYLDSDGNWLVPPQDPNDPVDPATWLAMDEQERHMRLIAFHLNMPEDEPHPPMENVRMHAVAHCIVENQLAEGMTETVENLERLMASGVTRHHAIHALGEVIMGKVFQMLNGFTGEESSDDDVFEGVAREMDQIEAHRWLPKKRPSPPKTRKIDRKKQKAKRKAGRKKR